MRKYRILVPPMFLLLLGCAFVLPWAHVAAQQAAGSVKVTPTTVTRVILLKVTPGQRPALDQDVMDNLVPIYEEEKKAGILANYSFFNNVTTDNPNDWGFGIILTYANYAALDNLGDRTDPITLKHYGSVAQRQAAADRRNQTATVVSNRLIREVRYSRPGMASN